MLTATSKGELVTRKVPYIHITMCTLGLVAWKQILLIQMRDYGQYTGRVTYFLVSSDPQNFWRGKENFLSKILILTSHYGVNAST